MYFRERNYEYFCTVCDSYVLGDSKHCMQCNRCTYEFDHHCYWINNDIGLHNYAAFLRMLSALIITLLIQIGFSIYAICGAIPDDIEHVSFLDRTDYMVINYVTLGVAIVILALDTYLLLFHISLIRRDTTTYKHIRMK